MLLHLTGENACATSSHGGGVLSICCDVVQSVQSRVVRRDGPGPHRRATVTHRDANAVVPRAVRAHVCYGSIRNGDTWSLFLLKDDRSSVIGHLVKMLVLLDLRNRMIDHPLDGASYE